MCKTCIITALTGARLRHHPSPVLDRGKLSMNMGSLGLKYAVRDQTISTQSWSRQKDYLGHEFEIGQVYPYARGHFKSTRMAFGALDFVRWLRQRRPTYATANAHAAPDPFNQRCLVGTD